MANKEKKAKAVKSPVEMQPKADALRLPNYSMALLYQLLNVPLHGAQSRARNRFAQIIKNRVNYLEDERIRMLESRCKKDKQKQPLKKMQGDEEVYDIEPKAMAEYQKEFDTMMHEDTIIDILPSTKQDLALIRPLILDSKQSLTTIDGYTYEEICKGFEAI